VPIFVLAGLLPASVFIGESVRDFKKRYETSFMRLAFCVLATFVLFYSFSGTKLPNYPMPCYPFAAIVLAWFITLGIKREIKTRSYPFYILLVINLALPLGLYFGIKNEVELKGFENLAFIAALLTIASILSLYLLRKNGFKAAVISLMVLYTLFNLIFFNYLYPAIYLNNPLSKTIGEVKKYDEVVSYKIFHPSYTFYLPNRVRVFEEPDLLQRYLSTHKALVITRKSLLPEIDSLKLQEVATHHDLFESATTVLYTNEKK
jgi:4-amino-4-deoxy-L-arabinose transferase-like glycosyltransferase